ncbi:MAG TPA: MaoC family dehydratase N-terminal domain-containing protein [Caldimonas sp.]|nr:MaoC family dehydratase N-terminal domain-containing protein [Caldimonas sp.]
MTEARTAATGSGAGHDEVAPSDLDAWIGRTEERRDTVTAVPMAALAASLDRDEPMPRVGTELPALWHWLYFLPLARQGELGPDGHPKRGGFLPPVPLPRRMWAGSRLVFDRPLRVGDDIARVSRIASIVRKEARSGPLVFVTVQHEIAGPAGTAIHEEHDIVYRDAASTPRRAASPALTSSAPFPPSRRTAPSESSAPLPPSDPTEPIARAGCCDAVFSRVIVPNEVLLFRYSALTFNGHRIHYDRRYATEVEGYPGLVVHGPLIATLLLELLRREQPRATVSRFEFRALRPIFDVHPFTVCGRPDGVGRFALWVRDAEEVLAMRASAEVGQTRST